MLKGIYLLITGMQKKDNADVAGEGQFKRVLGLPTAVMLVAGIMIGSGVFKKIVPMAQLLPHEGYILLAWIIAGVVSLFGAFTYAGLAGMTTETGGVYEYLRLIFGEFIAFLFGWSLFTIVGTGAIAALAFVFAQSVNELYPLPFGGWGIKLLAVVAIFGLTWLNCLGIKKGGVLSNIVTSAKIGGMLALIVAGLFYHGHSQGQAPAGTGVEQLSGSALFSALLGVMLSALWAYDGWANITFITGEIRDPRRNVPYAIIGGVGIAMTLYVLLNYSYMRVLPLSALSQLGANRIAAAEVARVLMGKTGAVVIAILIMTCTFGALNGCILSYPRVYFRMAQERVFFRNAGRVHAIFRTPYVALIYSAIWSVVLVCSGTFDQITDLVVFASYAFFGLAAWGLMRMKRKGVIERKVIGYPVIPIVVILFCVALVINTVVIQTRASLLGLLLIGSGVPFYLYFRWRYKSSV
jgi:APA family basic amino acid/polyamine antiporter